MGGSGGQSCHLVYRQANQRNPVSVVVVRVLLLITIIKNIVNGDLVNTVSATEGDEKFQRWVRRWLHGTTTYHIKTAAMANCVMCSPLQFKK